jgi:hypothetical protein
MSSPLTQRKWREARYFLGALSACDGDPNLEKAEEFGFLTSAFLTAARSVIDTACKENPGTFAPVFDAWKSSLDAEMCAIHEFVGKRRVRTVHFGEESTQQSEEFRPALHVQSRSVAPWAFDEGAYVAVSVYSIQLDGEPRSAREYFSRYLDSLAVFVAELGA